MNNQVHASDDDDGENSQIVYSLHHVSNNGKNKFLINAESGQIEAIGKLVSGQQYSLTVNARDGGNKTSHTILDVSIIPGPNTGGPVFEKEAYQTQISEGASLHSPVIDLMAIDPDGDAITYSIVDGDPNEDFLISRISGIISTNKKLNREKVMP